MSESIDLRGVLDMASELRSRASRLRVVADRLDADAALLDEDVAGNGSQLIGGRALIDKACTLIEPGESIHYRDLTRRLRGAGYVAKGMVPENTVLAALGRSSSFTKQGTRTGIYRRAA